MISKKSFVSGVSVFEHPASALSFATPAEESTIILIEAGLPLSVFSYLHFGFVRRCSGLLSEMP